MRVDQARQSRVARQVNDGGAGGNRHAARDAHDFAALDHDDRVVDHTFAIPDARETDRRGLGRGVEHRKGEQKSSQPDGGHLGLSDSAAAAVVAAAASK